MAYLGAIGIKSRTADIYWARNVIASVLIVSAIGPYAGYGGYVYVA